MEKKAVEESSVDISIAVQGRDQSHFQGDVVRVYHLQLGSFIDPVGVNVTQVMHKAEKKYEVGKVSGKEDAIQRQLKAILNKLTPQNFEKLCEQVMEVNINTASTLTVIISHIFVAMMESTICETYANFCNHLIGVLPKFCEDDEEISFIKLLLDKCQQEFKNREREQAEAVGGEIIESQWCKEEIEEKKVRAHRQMLGNIQFIGELYKKNILTEGIVHSCIKKLLSQYQNPDEEDVEALCKLMSTIGEMLDHRKSKEHMDAYFDMMLGLSNNYNLSFKVRFMLKDVIDLRENKWQKRKHEGLTMTEDVHKDARPKQRLRAGRPSHGVRYNTLPGQSGFMNRMQVLHKAEKKFEGGGKVRQLKAILYKLTPQNVFKVFEQVQEINIDSATTLTAVVSLIFDKALMEPTICEMYADFCYDLACALPDFSEDNEKITFKRLLLNKCQEEFERGEREKAEACRVEDEGEIKQSEEEREEKKVKSRRRMLGNIRLIGELYKKRMLTERTMHECIKKLLGQHQSPDEEDIESLCELMSTIGEMIDHPKTKEHMDAYFDMMLKLSNNHKLSSRVRFMLKDAIDLRKNKWRLRKHEGLKMTEEVHKDAGRCDVSTTMADCALDGEGGDPCEPSNPSGLPSDENTYKKSDATLLTKLDVCASLDVGLKQETMVTTAHMNARIPDDFSQDFINSELPTVSISSESTEGDKQTEVALQHGTNEEKINVVGESICAETKLTNVNAAVGCTSSGSIDGTVAPSSHISSTDAPEEETSSTVAFKTESKKSTPSEEVVMTESGMLSQEMATAPPSALSEMSKKHEGIVAESASSDQTSSSLPGSKNKTSMEYNRTESTVGKRKTWRGILSKADSSPQSQPIHSFSFAHPINYFSPIQPNSYNPSIFFSKPSSLPLTSTQMTPGSSATRYNYPVGQGGPPVSFMNPSVLNPLTVSKARPAMHGASEPTNLEHTRDGYLVAASAPFAAVRVTVKPPVKPVVENVATSVTVSSPVTKSELPKLLRQPGEASVSNQQMNNDIGLDSSQLMNNAIGLNSCLKQTMSLSESSELMPLPVTVEHSTHTSAFVSMPGLPSCTSSVPVIPAEESAAVMTNAEGQRREPVKRSNSLKDQQRKPSKKQQHQVIHKAEKKYGGGKLRQLKAILNKLTPQSFFKVFEQVKEVNIGSAATLTAVISVIFDKALMEPTICEMYADFCFHLACALPDFSEDNEKITFKRLLLNKCQEEFERGEREKAEACRVEDGGEIKQSNEEREEKKVKSRRRMLGNIRQIGELYKKRMLTERIMHECIKKLLGHHQSPGEEDIESMCKLMSTIVEMIDHPKAKEHMDAAVGCTSSGSIDGTVAPSSHISSTDAPEEETSSTIASKTESKKSTPSVEVVMTESGMLSQEMATAPPSALSEMSKKHEGTVAESASSDQTSSSLPGSKNKTSMEYNRTKSTVGKRKKWREILSKADAAGISSDLYMAHKGPEEKNEISVTSGSIDSSVDVKHAYVDSTERGTIQVLGYTMSGPMDTLMSGPMDSSYLVDRDSYTSSERIIDRPTGGSRLDRRGRGIVDDDKWGKTPGSFSPGRDPRLDVTHGGIAVNFRPGQAGNRGILRNPHVQSSGQCVSGILSRPMQAVNAAVGCNSEVGRTVDNLVWSSTSSSVSIDGTVAPSSHISSTDAPEEETSSTVASKTESKKSTPSEVVMTETGMLSQEMATAPPSALSELSQKHEGRGADSTSGSNASTLLLGSKDKISVEQNRTKSTAGKRKKRREFFIKEDAARITSDLYMAYKGPEEKNEISVTSGSIDSSVDVKHAYVDSSERDTIVVEDDGQNKSELYDW